MTATLFRAKIYKKIPLPGRNRFADLAIAFGPLRTDCQRVINHVTFLNASSKPQVEAVLQKVQLCVE